MDYTSIKKRRNKTIYNLICLRQTVLLFLFASPIYSTDTTKVVINEVLYDPFGTDTGLEWIEFYNGDTLSYSLTNHTLNAASGDYYRFPSSFVLPSHQFVLVHWGASGTDTQTDLYTGRLANWDNMGNTEGWVALFSDSLHDTIIDYLEYGSDGQTHESKAVAKGIWTAGSFLPDAPEGSSLGLRYDGLDSNKVIDWKILSKPTGGRSNNPCDYDVGFLSPAIIFSPPLPSASSDVSLLIRIMNFGLKPAENIELKIWANNILIVNQTFLSLASADSINFSFLWQSVAEGFYNILAKLNFNFEQDTTNNQFSKTLRVGNPVGDVVINEIMYHPLSNQPEWVELFNRSQNFVSLKNWSISDGVTVGSCTSEVNLSPGSFLIFSEDSLLPPCTCQRIKPAGEGLPTLNDDGDSVSIFDSLGTIVDQVSYKRNWGGETGISLERVSPELPSLEASNWGSCVGIDGSTPGKKNSLYCEKIATQGKLSVSPNPFSPDGDGYDDHTIISYHLPLTKALVVLSIYDIKGRLVRHLLDREESGTERSLIWDGKDNEGNILPIGIYLVYLEAGSDERGSLVKAKTTVVLAKKLR
ncbi:MAG: lamin tail domain-containing protein [Candidatus Edwardsbacteria bacterium]